MNPLPPPSHLAADAPIVALLRLTHHSTTEGKMVHEMSPDELQRHISRIASLRQQPATLDSQLRTESAPKKKREGNALSAKKKAILDTL